MAESLTQTLEPIRTALAPFERANLDTMRSLHICYGAEQPSPSPGRFCATVQVRPLGHSAEREASPVDEKGSPAASLLASLSRRRSREEATGITMESRHTSATGA